MQDFFLLQCQKNRIALNNNTRAEDQLDYQLGHREKRIGE